eukprot:6182824-Pleurochrysis_carterae.AAC.1
MSRSLACTCLLSQVTVRDKSHCCSRPVLVILPPPASYLSIGCEWTFSGNLSVSFICCAQWTIRADLSPFCSTLDDHSYDKIVFHTVVSFAQGSDCRGAMTGSARPRDGGAVWTKTPRWRISF